MSYNYARWVDAQIDTGRANQPRFETLLASVDPTTGELLQTPCADDPDCPGLWNPFVENSLTPEMQNYALVTNSPVERSRLLSFQANVVGDFCDFAIGAEPWQWALGYEHRSEKAEVVADGAASLGQIYFVSGEDWGGSYTVDEGYGELVAPLMEGQPWADLLSAELSFRYSDYNTVGDDTVWGVVLDYAPIEQVRFRGTYSEGFRAPGIDDLFLPGTQSAETYSDPCYQWDQLPSGSTVRANCQADGVNPNNGLLASPQATGLLGGNEDLKSEESENWTLGIVWTPTFIEDLSFTVDYFNITIDDAIGTFTTNTLVSNCYNSVNFSSPACDFITGAGTVGLPASSTSPRRQVNGTIAGQLLNAQNIATFETDGVDLGASYSMELGPGTVTFDGTATYLHEWKYQASEDEPVIDLAGHFGADPVTTRIAAFPHWKFYLTGGYEYDCWSAQTTVRMVGEVDDIDPGDTDLATHVDNTWYQDINFNYFRWEDVTLSGGIRNMWNQQPPYVTNYDDMNTLPLNYDTVGRFFYGRVTFKF
ncbi:TonB-dependent receptor domain-containing protein [Microbulbifer taiwanensis]